MTIIENDEEYGRDISITITCYIWLPQNWKDFFYEIWDEKYF